MCVCVRERENDTALTNKYVPAPDEARGVGRGREQTAVGSLVFPLNRGARERERGREGERERYSWTTMNNGSDRVSGRVQSLQLPKMERVSQARERGSERGMERVSQARERESERGMERVAQARDRGSEKEKRSLTEKERERKTLTSTRPEEGGGGGEEEGGGGRGGGGWRRSSSHETKRRASQDHSFDSERRHTVHDAQNMAKSTSASVHIHIKRRDGDAARKSRVNLEKWRDSYSCPNCSRPVRADWKRYAHARTHTHTHTHTHTQTHSLTHSLTLTHTHTHKHTHKYTRARTRTHLQRKRESSLRQRTRNAGVGRENPET